MWPLECKAQGNCPLPATPNSRRVPGYRCWLRNYDDSLLLGRLLLHHHRLDDFLPDCSPLLDCLAYLGKTAVKSFSLVADNWWNTANCYTSGTNATMNHTLHHIHTTTPVEEYWEKRVLQITDGIENIGGMQWELLGCLTLGWALVYLIICRGLHSSGKAR
uniref:Uncharacterized protein n=1 Tax=Timema poppense TaxID=170557 RepID=A0A7R9D5D7_TIMPO|nr:unnamed protein product [Timema poppensis]